MTDPQPRLVFGIYPGGESGSDKGAIIGPPDDPDHIEQALTELQGNSSPFLVRAYYQFSDPGSPPKGLQRNPENVERYLHDHRLLDLVLKFQSSSGNVDGYLGFIRDHIHEYCDRLYSVQITEEANFTHGPDCIDGPYPRVREALVQGVIAAKRESQRLGLPVKIGFNSTPTFGPSEEFWAAIGLLGGKDFGDSLDYVGLDFFPDVFRPAAPDGEPGDLRTAVTGVLTAMRQNWLPAAGIPPTVPIHIAEHGWPTGPGRSVEQQCVVLEKVVRTIHEAREQLNIERYTLFSLRDTDSSAEHTNDTFYHFGILRDDYSAKPAFEIYRKLVEKFGIRLP